MHRLFLILLTVLFACNQRRSGIIIAGSTSIQPFIEKVAENFMEKYPTIKTYVQGGGSTAGIQATFNKTCDLGTSSRKLKPNESNLKKFLIAIDGITVIVHENSLINNLTIEQIRGIFSGKIKNWKELGGKDQEIIPVTREEGSGTRASFEDMVMGGVAISDACLVQDSNGAVREIIATTPEGIGYISVGLVDEREKAVAINGIKPTIENLMSGEYKFSRPFLLLSICDPSGDVKKFIDYVLSNEGQNILRKGGLIPVDELKSER